jgi:hypothetical protein
MAAKKVYVVLFSKQSCAVAIAAGPAVMISSLYDVSHVTLG